MRNVDEAQRSVSFFESQALDGPSLFVIWSREGNLPEATPSFHSKNIPDFCLNVCILRTNGGRTSAEKVTHLKVLEMSQE